MRLAFTWKGLPANRVAAAQRAAALCPIHATLSHGGAAVTVEGQAT